MKLLIIRHGDPDYEKDSLTKTGWREAELLANRLKTMDIAAFYVSPLGRAQDTASCTLKAMHRTAETLDWLQEFPLHRMDADHWQTDAAVGLAAGHLDKGTKVL